MAKSEVYNVQRKLSKQMGDDFEKSDRLMDAKINNIKKQITSIEKQHADEKERMIRTVASVKKEMAAISKKVEDQFNQ